MVTWPAAAQERVEHHVQGAVMSFELPGGTHFLLNDPPERGLDAFARELVTFLER